MLGLLVHSQRSLQQNRPDRAELLEHLAHLLLGNSDGKAGNVEVSLLNHGLVTLELALLAVKLHLQLKAAANCWIGSGSAEWLVRRL